MSPPALFEDLFHLLVRATFLNSACPCRRQLHRWIYCFTAHKGQLLADFQWNLGFDWMSCWILLGCCVPALSCFFLLRWRRPAINAMRVKSVFTANGDIRSGLLCRCVCGCRHKCASYTGRLCRCDGIALSRRSRECCKAQPRLCLSGHYSSRFKSKHDHRDLKNCYSGRKRSIGTFPRS